MSLPEPPAPDSRVEPPRGFVAWLDRWGVPACFLWGIAEATLFFVVPDVIVGLVALYRPRKALRAAAAAIGGALVGGLAVYLTTRAVGLDMRDVIDGVPFIPNRMLLQARREVTAHGGAAMVIAPLTGIPYKVYVVEMALRSWNVLSLLLWTIPARAVRIVPVALVAAGVGLVFRHRFGRRPFIGLLLYAAVWVAIYASYWRSTGL